jgi:serine/arginine repetitive matrix protein 1
MGDRKTVGGSVPYSHRTDDGAFASPQRERSVAAHPFCVAETKRRDPTTIVLLLFSSRVVILCESPYKRYSKKEINMPIKGTMSVADNHAMTKMLRQTKFPESFSTRVNLSKVNIPVLSQWTEEKINSMLGFEDEIVSSTAINLFMPTASADAPPPTVDPRRAQIDLAGFLGEAEAASFAEELWGLLVDAQSTTTGIPKKLLEEKKKELAKRKAAAASRPHDASGMDRRVVEQASQRAERAREAIAARPELVPAAGAPPPERGPRPVSPQHLKQPALRNDGPAGREEPKSQPREKKSSTKDADRLHASSSRSSSESSRSIDSEEDRGRSRRRDHRYRYEDEQDRGYYEYSNGRDHYGRRYYDRDYDHDRRRIHREDDRDPFGRRRRSRSRSRSHERDRRYRGGR